MLVTLANPLNLAIVGNPPGKRRRKSTARSRALARVRQLRYRWNQRTRPGGRYAGFHAVVHAKPGRRRKHRAPRGRRWAWTGRKGTVHLLRKGILVATNPVLSGAKDLIVRPVTSLPKSLPALLKGNVAKNLGIGAAGALTGLVGGNFVQGAVIKALSGVMPDAVAKAMANDIVQRVVGASFALVTGGLVAKFAIKNPQAKAAFVTGTAAAALFEAIFPGRVAKLLADVPVIGGMIGPKASPVQGLAGLFGYYSTPGYQGVGEYVDAPSYQGVNGMGAYVDAPSYQGVNGPMDDAVAGLHGGNLGYDPNQLAGAGHLGDLGAMGANMASHLDS